MKTCTKCEESKPLREFHRHKTSAGGRLTQCRSCRNDYVREYRQKKGWQVRGWDTLARKAERAARRRARVREQLCTCCSSKDIARLYEIRPEGCHIDHIIPISRGGLHCLSNLQILPAEVNLRKFVSISGY